MSLGPDPKNWIPLIGSLGSAAAAVIVTFMFIGFMRNVISDRAAVIHEVSVALAKNTAAIEHLESTLSAMARTKP